MSVVSLVLMAAPDDEDVVAGWTAFAIFGLLILAVVILGFSLVKHLRRARDNFDERDGVDENGTRPGTTD